MIQKCLPMPKSASPLLAAACGLALLTSGTQTAVAATITVEITATVRSVTDTANILGGTVVPGDTVRGFYTFESATPDSIPDTAIGEYRHTQAPFGIALEVKGLTFQTDPTRVNFLILAINNFNGTDAFQLLSYNNLYEVSAAGAAPENTISWGLGDTTMTALNNDSLPTSAPVLASWQPNPGLDISSKGTNEFLIRSDVISAVVIPEPSTGGLIGIAAGIFAIRRKRATSR
jgi:hypothetical protein